MTAFDPPRIFETLDRHGVDYITIGAWAVIAHGYARATADIDFIARLDEANMNRLVAALSELNARIPTKLEGTPGRAPGVRLQGLRVSRSAGGHVLSCFARSDVHITIDTLERVRLITRRELGLCQLAAIKTAYSQAQEDQVDLDTCA